MTTRPSFDTMLAIAPNYNDTKQSHKDTNTKRHTNTIGSLYLSRLATDGLESASLWVWATARRGALKRIHNRSDTLNRTYSKVQAEQFANNVASDILIACRSLSPDKVSRVTLRSAIDRVDRGENKATKYWTCLYFVRFNFIVGDDGKASPSVGEWCQVSQRQYKLARKIESPEQAPYRWVECLEYRKTVRNLTDADHENDGYTTQSGDTKVQFAIRSTLTPTEQDVIRLYGMGVQSQVIARSLLGNCMVKGDAAKIRILVSRTLAKLAAACGERTEQEAYRPIRRSVLAPTV